MIDQKKIKEFELDNVVMPKHVAIIMDGNGRWAKKRLMPRTYGHKKGVEKVREILKASSAFGIKHLTIYAFSTENWKRPKEEVDTLMYMFGQYLKNELDELNERNVRLKIIGDKSKLSVELQELIASAEESTKNNDDIFFNIAINYGSQDEIENAAFMLAKDYREGLCELTKEEFAKRLYTSASPNVDFMIRTSGEQRISNFLLYQLAYAELYFTNTLWPDFDTAAYADALKAYSGRDRRYGGIKNA